MAMSPRQRFLTAIRNQVPDRVPAAPDISNYIPCKRTGLPFWSIYFDQAVPLWQAYLEAMDYFGGEAWIASCAATPLVRDETGIEQDHEDVYDEARDAMVRRTTTRTPEGTLTSEWTCFRYDPPTPTGKPIKRIERDFGTFKRLLAPAVGIDEKQVEAMRRACHERQQAFGLTVGYPGFHSWEGSIERGIEALAYAQVDCPHLLDEWHELDLARYVREMELILSVKPDYVLFGGSGTITLASPELAARYAMPALRRCSAMAREAGVPTMLHSCGKSRRLLEMLVEQTDVDLINPLEPPPMGDVDLAEAKRLRGDRIALMGNLHTTDLLLRGSPDEVRRAALRAMCDAGANGGFVLSTGDQCPRETPVENLFTLIETAREFGRYDRATGTLPDVASACE